MSNHFLEGEAYYVLKELDRLTQGKKTEISPEKTSRFTFTKPVDYYVFFDPDKETIERINCENFIVCFLDKNVDLRLDYVKKIKQKSEYKTFDPIPTTDFNALRNEFSNVPQVNFLPSKKMSLKYKGAKQNYEWYDMCLISDLSDCSPEIFNQVFNAYFDIWSFSDHLWSGNKRSLDQVKYIDGKNFEEYFNRIRETSKDYIELLQTQAKSLYDHKRLYPESSISNDYRFAKIKEKLNLLKPGTEPDCLNLFEACLKNVRLGSNPKLEIINLILEFKKNVS